MIEMMSWSGKLLAEIVGVLISFICNLFVNVDISAAVDAIEVISKYIRAACYFLPMGAISAIFVVIIGFWNMRLIIKSIITVWNLIPIV